MVEALICVHSTSSKVRKYRRSKYFVTGTDKLWQVDLGDMSMISKDNDNCNYMLTYIDVFSKYVSAIPVKLKSGNDVSEAFAKILGRGENLQNFNLTSQKNL